MELRGCARCFAVGLLLICPAACAIAAPAISNKDSTQTIDVPGGSSSTTVTPSLTQDGVYAILISVPHFTKLGEKDRLDVSVEDAHGVVVSKRLHEGDADLYYTLRAREVGPGRVTVDAKGPADKHFTVTCSVEPMSLSGRSDVIVAAGPNNTCQTAQPIELGKTVFASNDERPYVPSPDGPEKVFADMLAGAQWYTFTYKDDAPKLVQFFIDILDRDIPADVAIFTRSEKQSDRLVPYDEGLERYITEQSNTFHGLNKMISRVIRKGTYYVRVMGNHPAYQLRTNVYDPPPYRTIPSATMPADNNAIGRELSRKEAAEKAIRVGMDYLVNRGDSWHANTPRKGAIALRTSTALQETQLCIACHPTHFTTRAEMVAVENGWPVKQRSALKFLTERLYNNPRPLYGDPEAAWVRVISAPGNVTSRLAYMEMEFEKYVSGEPRANIMEDLSRLLEQYWTGMTATIDESNGNLPRVSGFEIALHSRYVFDELYRRTGKPEYSSLRDRAEKVALDSKPVDMLDLCWKAVALASTDPAKYTDRIKELVEQIFSYQKADGTWSMVFGKKILSYDYNAKKHNETAAPLDADGAPKASEFQTYHCLYTLAKCGVTVSDPRLAKTLDWCLSRQWPHGAWQGNTDFKNFDTTFRETQFAVMALSELFKGPGSKGWNAGFPKPPGEVSTDTVDGFLAAVDQYWEKPDPRVLEQIRAALSSKQPLIRQAAAECLGRLADAESLSALIALLGDESKMVQRSAAWAVREIATRRSVGAEQILAALKSNNDRTRWGAMRVFNQHFRYLSANQPLLDAMMDRMQHDPSATLRMSAAQSLAKWWFWLKDPKQQERIEQAFIDNLGRPEHPWVRRALIEGLRNVLDDNTRYLYNTWIPALKRPEDRHRVETAHPKLVMDQATRIGKALVDGNDLQRDGVLRCFYTFHLHEPGGDVKLVANVPLPDTYLRDPPGQRGENKWIDGYKGAATYDPLTMGTGSQARLGNDSEPPEYKGEAATQINRSLAALLKSNPSYTAAVLKTVKHLKSLMLDDVLSAELVRTAMNVSPQQAKEAWPLLREVLPMRLSAGDALIEPMTALLKESKGDALNLGAEILSQPARSSLANSPDILKTIMGRLAVMPLSDPDTAALIEATTLVTAVQNDANFVEKAFTLTDSGPVSSREQVMRMMLRSPSFLGAIEPRKRFDRLLRGSDADQMTLLLKVVSAIDPSSKKEDMSTGIALAIITTGSQNADDAVRSAALESIRSVPAIQKNPAIIARVRELASLSGDASSASAKTLLISMSGRNKSGAEDPAKYLDFEYFVRNVQPILQTAGEDRLACVSCHANHTIFKLNEPGPDGQLTDAQLRENYRGALRVVDLAKPQNSLILKKPTSPFDGIGVPGSYTRTHGGDVRWIKGIRSDEYRAILKWLQGARVNPSSPPAEPPRAETAKTGKGRRGSRASNAIKVQSDR